MKNSETNNFIRYLISSLIVIILGSFLGYYQLSPTRVPKDYDDKKIPISQVSSDKADFSMVMSHVYHMSKEIHPSGSEEIKRVQDYLTEQFKAIGCEYQTQNFEVDLDQFIEMELTDYEEYINDMPDKREPFEKYLKDLGFSSYEEKLRHDYNYTTNTYLPMTNYLVKLDAPDTEESVLFVSHYDSTTGGPGASDDLISVSAMLEALREAAGYETRKNDLYFLFTDGEEMDLFGAEHYVSSQVLDKDKIKLVINLEARGNTGPLIMFETSLQNKGIIKVLNKALDHNLMFSFAAAVYRLMPNNTDLSSFLKRGYPGINFAMIGSPEHYHQRTDTFENIDRDSAYMYYKSTTTLTNYFSHSDLSNLRSSEDAVYFPFFKGNTVVVSNQLMLVLSYFIGALSLLWIGFLLFKKVIARKSFTATSLFILLSLVPAFVLGLLCSFLYNHLALGREFLQVASMLNFIIYAFYCLTILVLLALLWLIIRRRNIQTVIACLLLLFTLINIACTVLLNGLSYIFTIPLGLLLFYSIILYFSKNKTLSPLLRYLYVALFGFILCLLYIPVLDIIYTALLNASILAIFPLASLGVLPIAVLCKSITYKTEGKEVQP